jgi:phosphotransferase system enzyme I (PtsI)
LNRQRVKGIVTEIGGSNSHSAILARSFQIPAVLGVADAMSEIPDGALLGMDALSGILIVNPDGEELAVLEEKKLSFLKKRQMEEEYLDKPGKLKDGAFVEIGINVGSTDFDVPKTNFDFAGLFRTEFLYMENTHLPTEEEQFEAYKKVIQNAKGNPVTLRTLDIGGDKTLPYMELPKEENPFLGNRALRLCFAEPNIFMTQLRAALRASVYGPLQIMFPMVGSMEDIYRAKAYVKEAMEQLEQEREAFDRDIKIGIMIEVPSIALIADMAAEEVDFASIGSNDLTQYVCATDRMNPEVTEYYQNYSPAMIRLLGYIAQSFVEKGKALSVCGEMAGNPNIAVVLAGLGIKKLSMSAANIAGVKAALAQVSLGEAKELAARCKQAKTEDEVRAILNM